MVALVRLFAVFLAALGLSGAAAPSRVPAGVTSVRIRSAAGITRVTRPAAVLQIVTWFDALPRFVERPCPYTNDQPPDVRFAFRTAGGGVALRAVDHLPGTCSGSITSKGRLLADDGFVARVSRLTGVDFDPNAGTEQNEAAAKRYVQMLLGRARVPAGSRPLAEPRTTARGAGATADAQRTWRVHRSLAQVFAFEHAHRPRGRSEVATSAGSTDSVSTSRDLTVYFPPFGGPVPRRYLDFELDALPGGWTRIRIEAQDTWVVVRSRNEKVPAGVTQVLFRSHLITDRAKVAKIVRWFDALPVVQPVGWGCPLLMSSPLPVLRLDFRDAAGHVLAGARMWWSPGNSLLSNSTCSPIEVNIGGHAQTPLDGGDFFRRVNRLAR